MIVTGLFFSLFGGIVAAVVGVSYFENYNSPYLFGFITGTLGLIAGLWVTKKLKPYVVFNPKISESYSNLAILFSVGFIGAFMLAGQYLNSAMSTLVKCDRFAVTAKEFQKKGFRKPELYILILNVEGIEYKLICTHNYWRTISAGESVNACIYKSPVGFDYITLPDNR